MKMSDDEMISRLVLAGWEPCFVWEFGPYGRKRTAITDGKQWAIIRFSREYSMRVDLTGYVHKSEPIDWWRMRSDVLRVLSGTIFSDLEGWAG